MLALASKGCATRDPILMALLSAAGTRETFASFDAMDILYDRGAVSEEPKQHMLAVLASLRCCGCGLLLEAM